MVTQKQLRHCWGCFSFRTERAFLAPRGFSSKQPKNKESMSGMTDRVLEWRLSAKGEECVLRVAPEGVVCLGA